MLVKVVFFPIPPLDVPSMNIWGVFQSITLAIIIILILLFLFLTICLSNNAKSGGYAGLLNAGVTPTSSAAHRESHTQNYFLLRS